MRIIAIINKTIALENVFIESWNLFDALFIETSISKDLIIVTVTFFLILFFSFEDIEAVYINSVIIPDEKVKINTNAIQLEVVFLKIAEAARIEIIKMLIARKIGFFVLIVLIETIVVNIINFLHYFWFTKSMFLWTFRNYIFFLLVFFLLNIDFVVQYPLYPFITTFRRTIIENFSFCELEIFNEN